MMRQMMAKFGDAMKSGKMPDMASMMGGAREQAGAGMMPQRAAPKVLAAVGQGRPMTSAKSKSKQGGDAKSKAKGKGKK